MARIIGSTSVAAQFDALQEVEVGHFLLHVLEKPEDLVDHIRKLVSAFLVSLHLDGDVDLLTHAL